MAGNSGVIFTGPVGAEATTGMLPQVPAVVQPATNKQINRELALRGLPPLNSSAQGPRVEAR